MTHHHPIRKPFLLLLLVPLLLTGLACGPDEEEVTGGAAGEPYGAAEEPADPATEVAEEDLATGAPIEGVQGTDEGTETYEATTRDAETYKTLARQRIEHLEARLEGLGEDLASEDLADEAQVILGELDELDDSLAELGAGTEEERQEVREELDRRLDELAAEVDRIEGLVEGL